MSDQSSGGVRQLPGPFVLTSEGLCMVIADQYLVGPWLTAAILMPFFGLLGMVVTGLVF